jgi:hypothetical protein
MCFGRTYTIDIPFCMREDFVFLYKLRRYTNTMAYEQAHGQNFVMIDQCVLYRLSITGDVLDVGSEWIRRQHCADPWSREK